eukprot:347290-Chlamydomonas_euryale.AAC.3
MGVVGTDRRESLVAPAVKDAESRHACVAPCSSARGPCRCGQKCGNNPPICSAVGALDNMFPNLQRQSGPPIRLIFQL